MSAVLAERPITLEDILGPQWTDLEWRLRNLYHIVNEDGKSVPFEPNEEQLDVVRNLHTRNLILKARQLGFCLDPDTRVLTADLRWIRIADVQPGQELVATDENIPGGRGASRKMRTATVLATRVTVGRAYRMTFDDGRSVVCTGNHRWLTRKVATDATWRMIDDGRSSITVGTKVRWITKPWGAADFEDGWFGGMLDGEGSMAKDCHPAGVNVSQRPGPVWDRLRAYAMMRGYSACVEGDAAERPSKFGKTPVPKLAFGRMDELFRLMGQTRPTRFIGRRWWEGRDLPGKRTGEAWATVMAIEELNTRPMIDLQTTTTTFIAEGFVSHNSTLFEILQLDQALFNAHHTGSVISDTRENGGKLFGKIEHAYAKLPQALIDALPLKAMASKSSIEFEHGSGVWVATSARGGTVQFLHVSELGKISRRTPQRAQEIVSGGFEAVPQDGIIVVESTAEGAFGEFFDLCDTALKRQAEKLPETPLDWRLHFYPWFKKAAYRLDPALVHVSEKDHAYFDKIQAETGEKIDAAQRAWWVKKRETLGRNMKREYPACIAGSEPAFSPAGITRMDAVPVDGKVVLDFFPKGEREVFRVTTDLGYEVTCTADHPIKTPAGFVQVQHLRAGNEVMIGAAVDADGSTQVHRHRPIPCVESVVAVTADFAEMIGFYMGDGSYHDGTLSIVCDAEDTDVVARVQDLIAKFIAAPSTRTVGSKAGGAEVRVGSVKFGEVLDAMGMLRRNAGGGLMRRVHVPQAVNEAPLPVAAAFLRGLFEADGFAQRNGTGIKLFTKYSQFAREVQLLLLRFGITCRRTRHDKTAGNGAVYEGWELSLRTAEAVLFAQQIGFVSARKQARVESLRAPVSGGQKRLPVATTAKITAIEPAGQAPVFDITTATHEFSAGGIVVHNCPREAFEQAIEGAIFGEQMTAIREAGRITTVPLDVNYPVNTFWDFGLGARNPIWLHQRIGLQNRWVKYFDDFGKGLGWWWRTLEKWRLEHGEFQWGKHYLPHDADTEILGENVTTKHRILVAAGMRNTVVVPRVALKETAIDLAWQKLPVDNWFDKVECAEGIKALDGYQYEWDNHLGRFKNEPLANWAAHGADAWMQYAQGYEAPSDVDRERRRRPRNWKTS